MSALNLDLDTLLNLNVDTLTKPEGLSYFYWTTPAILVLLLPGVLRITTQLNK